VTPNSVREWHEKLLSEIERLADPAYREGSLMVAPTAQRVHGIRTPDNRRLARTWRRAHRETDPELVLSLVESLWNAESRDERALGLEILYLHPDIVRGLAPARFDRWRLDIDNWGVCDFVGTRILGPWVEADSVSRLAYLEELVGDPRAGSDDHEGHFLVPSADDQTPILDCGSLRGDQGRPDGGSSSPGGSKQVAHRPEKRPVRLNSQQQPGSQ